MNQNKFGVNDFSDTSAFQFLASQFLEKIYREQCDSCEYLKEGKCSSHYSLCTYKKKESYFNYK